MEPSPEIKDGIADDVSSSSYHGRHCVLAVFGYNRDGEKLPSIVYGLLCDGAGRPVSVEVYPGNTGDPATVPDQVEKLRDRFELERVVLVGDRGMLTQTRIKALRAHPNLGWISALRFPAIRALAEITSADFPGERLVVCHNPLLAATEAQLAKIAAEVARRKQRPLAADEIGVKVGRIIGRHKVGKHFRTAIGDGLLTYARDEASIARESRLDGFYVVRTSERAEDLGAEDAVRTYKSLGQVEQAFRCLKSIDLNVRPIRLRTVAHVRAHVFLCMLAYYVDWHMRKALSSVLFQDDGLDTARWERDPVAKAEPSESAREKKRAKTTPDGWPVHSLDTLLAEMGTRCRNTCRAGEGRQTLRFETLTECTPFQQHVFGLLEKIHWASVPSKPTN